MNAPNAERFLPFAQAKCQSYCLFRNAPDGARLIRICRFNLNAVSRPILIARRSYSDVVRARPSRYRCNIPIVRRLRDTERAIGNCHGGDHIGVGLRVMNTEAVMGRH